MQVCTLSSSTKLLVGLVLGDQLADRLGKEVLVAAPSSRRQHPESFGRWIGRIEVSAKVVFTWPLTA